MSLIPVERASPSGYVPLPCEIIVDDRTGQPAVGAEVLSLEGLFTLGSLEGGTGDAGLQMSLVGALLGSRDPQRSVTSYRKMLVIEAPAWVSVAAPDQEPQLPRLVVRTLRIPPTLPAIVMKSAAVRAGRLEQTEAAVTPAEELRSISGLPPALLAHIFGVSRTTYYKWIEGATPRDARFQHLVDVLAHVKEAQRKLSASVDVAAWLRTPISPGGRSPLDYLQQRRFSTFRGLLLRARSASMPLSAPLTSALAVPPLSRAEFEVARERVGPSPRFEEDESDESEGDDRR